jgi:hypothetical protein
MAGGGGRAGVTAHLVHDRQVPVGVEEVPRQGPALVVGVNGRARVPSKVLALPERLLGDLAHGAPEPRRATVRKRLEKANQ